MRQADETYAREALRWYAKTLPWLDLFDGVKEAMQHEEAARSSGLRVQRAGS